MLPSYANVSSPHARHTHRHIGTHKHTRRHARTYTHNLSLPHSHARRTRQNQALAWHDWCQRFRLAACLTPRLRCACARVRACARAWFCTLCAHNEPCRGCEKTRQDLLRRIGGGGEMMRKGRWSRGPHSVRNASARREMRCHRQQIQISMGGADPNQHARRTCGFYVERRGVRVIRGGTAVRWAPVAAAAPATPEPTPTMLLLPAAAFDPMALTGGGMVGGGMGASG